MVIDAGRAFFVSSAGSNVGDHPDLGGTRSSPACSSKCLQGSTMVYTKSTQSLHNDLVLTMSTPSVLVTPAPNWGNRPLFREVTLPRAIILRRTDYISTRPSIMTMPTKVILASSTSAPPPIPADNPWSRLLIMALSITLSVPQILQKKENRN